MTEAADTLLDEDLTPRFRWRWIQVKYLAAADEPPEPYDPFRDTRLIGAPKHTSPVAARLGR